MSAEPAPADASAEKLQVYLHGDGGGSWALGFVDGKLTAAQEDVGGTPLQLSLTVDDWRQQDRPRADERLRNHTRQLLEELEAHTGNGVVLNTSLNRRGAPGNTMGRSTGPST
mgnify:CR=1 FL=1